MRGARVVDRLFAVADQDLAVVRPVVAHDAFDERALAGAVLAEQSVKGAGLTFNDTCVERGELAEALGHRSFEPSARRDRRRREMPGDLDRHAIASMKAAEFDTAPNTPPCILIILMAWSWLPLSVAPQQSSSSTHSKPRSLASRMVVCTQTSVVMPVSTMFVDAAQPQHQLEIGGAERALAGLVDDRLAGQRRELGDDVPARLAAHQDAAARARIADAGADPARAPALVGRQIGEIGAMALAGVEDVEALRAHRREHRLIGSIGARVSERS